MFSTLAGFAVSFLAKLAMGWIADLRRDAANRSLGRAEARGEALEKGMETIREARRTEDETAARHRAEPSDDAFDQEFRRD